MAKPQLYQRVMRTIAAHGMFAHNARVLIALSGGPDSVALVALLDEIRQHWPALQLQLAHLNHCLRAEESDRDEAFVREFAARRSLDVKLARIDVAASRQPGEN